MMEIRVGQGHDVHALVPGRPLILGGVTIPHSHGLLGHSDADALLHAITDALLGGAGLGDLVSTATMILGRPGEAFSRLPATSGVARARERYAPDARFTTWLYTLARHRLVDHWRAQHGTRFVSLDDDSVEHADAMRAAGDTGDDRSDPLGQAIDGQAGRRLLQALDDVPAPQRDAFLLHVEAGLSLDEIAGLANVPAETIKSRLRYAYRRLRAALEDLQ